VTQNTVKGQDGKYRLRTHEYTVPPIAVLVAELSIAGL